MERRSRAEVRAQVVGCRGCGLSLSTRPIPFSGDDPSPFVVIGEAPGSQEDVERRPFVGPAGKLLRKVVDQAMGEGFAGGIAYVNAVCCNPGRTPTSQEVNYCRPNLTAQLELFQPWYALAVGGIAVSSFWNNIRIGDIRGRWWWEKQYREEGEKTWVMATWHPSAVLRQGGLSSAIGKEFVADIAEWARVVQDHLRPGLEVDCVKCGRGERKGAATVWERNLGACGKHASAITVSSATVKPRTKRTRGSSSASSPVRRGESAIPGTQSRLEI